MTTKLSTTSSTTEPSGCLKKDSRGIFWRANLGELATKPCPVGTNEKGMSRWQCSACLQDFETREPDRSECFGNWIDDINDMIDDGKPQIDILTEIANYMTLANQMATGGTLLNITDILDYLVTDPTMYKKNYEFAHKYTNISNEIFRSYVGWQEITVLPKRWKALSQNIDTLESVGYQLSIFDQEKESCGDNYIIKFGQVTLKTVSRNRFDDSGSICFAKDSKDSICVENYLAFETCNNYIMTSIKIKEIATDLESLIFPRYADSKLNNGGMLGEYLLGMRVNNGTNSPLKPKTTITFQTDLAYDNITGCTFVPKNSECIFWDTTEDKFSNKGCKLISETKGQETCECDHLTSFGIMLDVSPSLIEEDADLETATAVMIIISVSALVLTEAILSWNVCDPVKFMARSPERNRNFSLFLAQLSILFLVGSNARMPCWTCECVGAFAHCTWILAVCWIVAEGNFSLQRSVSTYPKLPRFLHYFFSYVLNIALVGALVGVSLTNGEHYYLNRDVNNEVISCWLHAWANVALIIPIGLIVLVNTMFMVYAVRKHNNKYPRERVGWKTILSSFKSAIFLTFVACCNLFAVSLKSYHFLPYLFIWFNLMPGVYILWTSIISNFQIRNSLKKKLGLGSKKK